MPTCERVIPILTYQDIPALAAGARIDAEAVDQPYGQREYGARDLEGHRWWFASPLSRSQQG